MALKILLRAACPQVLTSRNYLLMRNVLRPYSAGSYFKIMVYVESSSPDYQTTLLPRTRRNYRASFRVQSMLVEEVGRKTSAGK
jgi:hypothetical protein